MVTKTMDKKKTARKSVVAKNTIQAKQSSKAPSARVKKSALLNKAASTKKSTIKIATNLSPAVTLQKSSGTKHGENYWFMVLLYFASFLVGLGIIAMIAANWLQIPNNIKMIGALAAMIANAGILIWTIQSGKNVLKQVVACVYAFLIMGVIGLIGQIFHLPADIENALLLWSVVSWPLLFASPRLLWLWIPLFYCGIGCTDLKTLWQLIFDGSLYTWFHRPEINITSFGIGIDLLRNLCILGLFTVYEIFMLSKHSDNKTIRRPLFFFSGIMMYAIYNRVVKAAYATILLPNLALSLKVSLFGAYVLPCLILGYILLTINRYHNRNGFMPFFLLGTVIEYLWIFITIAANINVPDISQNGSFNHYPFEAVCPLLFLGITTIYTSYRRVDFRDRLACYIGLLIWFGVTFNENIFDLVPCLILCSIVAWMAYKENSRKWFNIAVLATVIRILGYYADVSDLLHAGFYLVGSGLFIIAVILLLMKYGRLLWENRNEK